MKEYPVFNSVCHLFPPSLLDWTLGDQSESQTGTSDKSQCVEVGSNAPHSPD